MKKKNGVHFFLLKEVLVTGFEVCLVRVKYRGPTTIKKAAKAGLNGCYICASWWPMVKNTKSSLLVARCPVLPPSARVASCHLTVRAHSLGTLWMCDLFVLKLLGVRQSISMRYKPHLESRAVMPLSKESFIQRRYHTLLFPKRLYKYPGEAFPIRSDSSSHHQPF